MGRSMQSPETGGDAAAAAPPAPARRSLLGRARLPRLLGRLLGCRKGAAAIELAFVLPVFLYLLTGIVEMAMLFYTTTVVDGAVADAGRKIRTGQAQLSGNTLSSFQTQLCSSLGSVYDCNSMTFNVQTFGSFATVAMPVVQLNADGDLVDEFGNVIVLAFNAGGAGQITVVRVIYSWKFFTPLIGSLMAGSNNTKLLSSTAVFRNEPYE